MTREGGSSKQNFTMTERSLRLFMSSRLGDR